MKVLQILPALEQGGVERVVCDLNRVVVSAGWESAVVSRGGGLVTDIESFGGRHIALEVKSKNPLSVPWRVWRLRSLLRRERPDLVCVHSRVPAWLMHLANRPLNLKWITYAHGANSVSRYSSVMTRGDRVVTPSRYLADYLRQHYEFDAAKVRVIHPAVDGRRFDPQAVDSDVVAALRREWRLGPDEKVVMAVGRLTPLKGYEELIKVWPPDMKLVIVGGADRHHADYERRLKELAGKNVIFAGAQSKIPECLTLASVLVSANVKKPESFGLSMVEALAMNVPVVARDFGGAREIVRDGTDGVLVKDGDFISAIRRAAELPTDGLRGAALKRFGFEAMAAKTVALYREMAA